MNTAICDTSVLIRLRKGNALHCLEMIFDRIIIPHAVKTECKDKETAKAIDKPFFEVRKATNILNIGMGMGEREAISLAVEMNVETIIIDDYLAFERSKAHGLSPIESIDILLLAKDAGYIDSIKDVLDLMLLNLEGITDQVYIRTLKKAGEI